MATTGRGIFSSFLMLQDELDRMVQDIVGGRKGRPRSWTPPADVVVCRDAVVVRFELAGVRKEDIELTFHNGELTVRGTRLESDDEPKQGYWQMEIWHGPFERSVKIPLEVDAARIGEAVCRDGILEVRLPIVADRRPTREVRTVAEIHSDA